MLVHREASDSWELIPIKTFGLEGAAEITVYPPNRVFTLDGFREEQHELVGKLESQGFFDEASNMEDASFDNINVALMGKAFHGTPVFVSEFTRSVRLWAIIRSYHLIEITIAIAMGVYLWLK